MTEQSRLIPRVRPVHGAEGIASLRLAETIVDIVNNARVNPTGDGITWTYCNERITAWSGPDSPPQKLSTRIDLEDGTRRLVDGNNSVLAPVEVVDGRLVGDGEHIDVFRRLRAGIYAGTTIGDHEVTVAKQIDPEEDSTDGSAILYASVTAISKGDGATPTAAIDLRFMRLPPMPEAPYDEFTVIQSHRITFDPATDSVEIGSVVNAETWAERSSTLDPARTARMNDAFTAMNVAGMQRAYDTQTPLDENPSTATWQQLVDQPLSPNEILRAPTGYTS